MTYLDVLQLILGLCIFLLGYVYVLFPLLVGMIGSHTKRQTDGSLSDDLPKVSLIIPAYNEEAVIEAKLHNALELDYPADRLEIIAACDGAEDSTAEIARQFQADRLQTIVFAQRRGKASVINDATKKSTGEILLFCDANVMFAPDALRRMMEHLQDASVGAVSGDVRLRSEDSSFGLAESLYYYLERRIHSGESRLGAMMGVDGGMYLIRRELFQPIAPDTILDDFTISMGVLRARLQILYEPQAIAHENATESATSEFKRRVRIGAGAAQVLTRGLYPLWSQPIQWWLFVSHKLLRWVSPLLLLPLLVLLGYLSVHDSRYGVPLVGAMVILSLAMIGAISPALRQRWIVSVPFYFVMSQLAMGYGLLKGMLIRQNAIWERTDRPSKDVVEGVGSDAK